METIDPNFVESWIQGTDDDVEREGLCVKAGSQWYVVSMKWLNKWRAANHMKLSDENENERGFENCEDQGIVIGDCENIEQGRMNRGKEDVFEDMDIDASPAPKTTTENSISDTQMQDTNTTEVGPVDSEDIIEVFENHVPRVLIKPDLIIGKEIEIIPPKAWNYFKEKYNFKHEIIRYSIKIGKSTKVEIYPKKIQIVLFVNKKLSQELTTFHISLKSKKQELESKVLDYAVENFNLEPERLRLFLWKFTETHDLIRINQIVSSGKPISARLLKDNDEISDLEIADEDIVLAEITENLSTSFREYQAPSLLSQISSNSRKGLTGLQNLGNTCFMNSGLQCLSNTHRLTEYMLSGQFNSDINKNNRISTKGKIVTAYADLVREMWKGSSSSVSPWAVKKALGSVAQQFMGFSQQDSQEMLCYLIDGIHEDINKAPKPKPTEIDEKGKNEEELANIWWEKHLERNQSIVVDLMHGQYKSQVRCKVCNNVSLAFDPFLMLTLPVPSKEIISKEITVVDGSKAFQFRTELSGQSKISEAIKKLPREMSSELFIVGECDGHSKEVRRIIAKHEIIDKNRDYLLFKYSPIDENSTLVLCNFSTKMYSDNYGCGTPLGITRLFIVEKGSLKDFHYSIYSQILKLSEEKDLEISEVQERFKQHFSGFFSDKKDLLYTLNIYNPGRTPCVICRKETCYGCPVPFNDEDLNRCLNVCRDPALFVNIIFKGDKHIISTKYSSLKYSITHHREEDSKSLKYSKELNIYDCLQIFQEEEELNESESIYCRNCKKHQTVFKKMSIFRLPEYLIIHLKRFKGQRYSMQKINSQVNFPIEGLEMEQVDGNRAVYDLYAVSNHYGSMGGGHYTAYCKNVNNLWYDFNDSSVSQVRDPSTVISSAAYVLFYKRR
jgi:ubiquitin C-terminal hydrolase